MERETEHPNNLITTVWFGKLIMKNNDIYACVYPSYYLDNSGNLKPTSVSFYKSSDCGHTWTLMGVIDYQIYDEYLKNPNLDFSAKGFFEPTFEFLKDGSILCVMRSTGPMYKSYSFDEGVNWTKPEPITPNGVRPQLMRLDNDILVLASGRYGIQLRFSCDGKGELWSDPIELVDYDKNKDNGYDTCGYPFLYKASDNEIYIVYSNFNYLNSDGVFRKSIVFRKIKVYRL